MLRVDLTRPGVWAELFPKALDLMQHLETVTDKPQWSFGGGTVLMLRINHRQSKDIDLFVPDPQYLGYVNPRLSDAAEAVTTEYEETAEHIKLMLPAGEIDIVVGTPLTPNPFEIVEYGSRQILVETNAEIIAKKKWHRGDRCKARDLFDLCAVAKTDPAALETIAPFVSRHGQKFLDVLGDREALLRQEFEAIDSLEFKDSFDQSAELGRRVIAVALGRKDLLGRDQVYSGHYIGPIVAIEDGVAIQRINARGDQVRHSVAALTKAVACGETVDIRYKGGMGLVDDASPARTVGLGR